MKLNANPEGTLPYPLIWSTVMLIVILTATSVIANSWFTKSHVGWLIEAIESPQYFLDEWQQLLAEQSELTHPAIVHWLPQGCLCNFLTVDHAGDVTEQGLENGFHSYQLNSSYDRLGETVTLAHPPATVGPLILITQRDGSLQYIGAYSDGVRCNSGSSMVESFIATPGSALRPVVGLDVETCRCQ